MAVLNGLAIDPNVSENTGDVAIIPEGKYKAVIMSDDLQDTKNKKGKMLNIKFKIVEGKYTGYQIVDRINIIHENMQTQSIGQGRLKGICKICDVPFPPSDTKKLYGIPMMITITVEQFQSNKSNKMIDSNKIKGYESIGIKTESNPKDNKIESW